MLKALKRKGLKHLTSPLSSQSNETWPIGAPEPLMTHVSYGEKNPESEAKTSREKIKKTGVKSIFERKMFSLIAKKQYLRVKICF